MGSYLCIVFRNILVLYYYLLRRQALNTTASSGTHAAISKEGQQHPTERGMANRAKWEQTKINIQRVNMAKATVLRHQSEEVF